jgi:hypothetical protein
MSEVLDRGPGHDAITLDAGGKDLVGNTNDMPQERISLQVRSGRRNHAKHVVLVAILTDGTLPARVNMAVLAVEGVRPKRSKHKHANTNRRSPCSAGNPAREAP